MAILYLTNDLMFSSRVNGLAHDASAEMKTTADMTELLTQLREGSIRVIFLDLSLPGLDPATVLPAIREAASDVVVVAYGPHVHEQKLAAASAAGCDEVMSRGEFNSTVGQLIARYAFSR